MFKFLKRNRFDDQKKQAFVEAVSAMLEVQLTVAAGRSLESAAGIVNGRALGYIYGFIDAALRTIGQDMSDQSVGFPITLHILARLFSGHDEAYFLFLAKHMGRDQVVTLGAINGGQQYVDFVNGKLTAPMGLARILVESSSPGPVDPGAPA